MFNKYKNNCRLLKISFKKDLIVTSIISGLCLVSGIVILIINQSIIGLLLLIISISLFFAHISSINSRANQVIDSKHIAFNSFYRYVVTLLENGNILYEALKSSLEYCDEVLLDDVNKLIEEIELDTSYQPFINFSENFNDEMVKQMIILLYQYSYH